MTARLRGRAIRCVGVAAALLLTLGGAGCGGGSPVETSYGRSRGRSLNGTGAFAAWLRDQGHEVRVAVRLTDELRNWGDVLVRFSPYSGPPPRDEAKWYAEWLDAVPGRRLVYVPHAYRAEVDYWTSARDHLPGDASPRLRERVDEALAEVAREKDMIGPAAPDPASPVDWFATQPPGGSKPPAPAKAATTPATTPAQAKGRTRFAPPSVAPGRLCKTLGGPWSAGVDPAGAALPVHEAFKVDAERVLLTGDGDALAITWTRPNDSRVLALADGSYLVNGALASYPARRPLAGRVVSWVGSLGPDAAESRVETAGGSSPKRVALIEGMFVTSDEARPPSVFDLLKVSPFGRVAAQLLILGLAACLARAPRLGRARPEPPSGADRPAAHPEALGALLARTGQAGEARSLLESYRRWRTATPAAPRARGAGDASAPAAPRGSRARTP